MKSLHCPHIHNSPSTPLPDEPRFPPLDESFPRGSKVLPKACLLFSKPPYITQFTKHINRAEWQTFFPRLSYPGKSVATNSEESRDALCLGTPRVGCMQSVILVRWDSLLLVHVYMSIYLSTCLPVCLSSVCMYVYTYTHICIWIHNP